MNNFVLREIRNFIAVGVRKRFQSTAVASLQNKDSLNDEDSKKNFTKLSEYRFVYPEFLPNPDFRTRHKITEKIERMDMLKRRSFIHIPEFYVGSILAVTFADLYAPGKKNRFVGICIHRTYMGLRATFTLRNVVDNQGVEIMFDLYNPTILSIDVLKLEKRLDDHLYYLRDALPEYSTIPFDMETEYRPEGEPVRVNPLKVKLKPPPWHMRWEQKFCKGIESIDGATFERRCKARKHEKPWEPYDLVKEYRRCIPEEDQVEIWQDVEAHRLKFPVKKQLWKKSLQKAPPKQPK